MVIIFIVILGVLIFAHEFGHFIIAKKSGVRVEEFGFGFPPRIFGIKRGETVYSLNLIPVGGFVKIYGEQGEGGNEPNSFISKSAGRRALILSAGVMMNFLLAMFLLSIGNKIGLPTIIDEHSEPGVISSARVQISEVAPGSPAEAAGIKTGDVISELKSSETVKVSTSQEVQSFIKKHKGDKIVLTLKRGDKNIDVSLVPRENPPAEEGPVGVALVNTAVVSYSWIKSLGKGVMDTINLTILIVVALGNIVHRAIVGLPVGEALTGPVGIYNITSQAAEMGFIYLLQLTALLSINLAIINILPFPALDGGRLLFLGIEKIKGSPVSQKIENFIHTVGFAFLILLMLLITYKDLTRFF
jgi:regulator of sigma E protease